MLDFDDKELLEGFEEEFKKKKRNKRSGNRFPSWIIVAIILIAAIFFFLYKRPDTGKIPTSGTPAIEFTQVLQFSSPTQQMNSSAGLSTEEGKMPETDSSAQVNGVSNKATSTPDMGSKKIAADTVTGSPNPNLVQNTTPVVHNTTSRQLPISETAIPVVSAMALLDSEPIQDATSIKQDVEISQITTETIEPQKINPTAVNEPEKATYNLNFFQKILFFLNPNWVSIPSLTPTVAIPLKITEENPFLNEAVSETLVASEHPEVPSSESLEITKAGDSEIGFTDTLIAETAVPKEANTQEFTQSMTAAPEKAIKESMKGTNISVAIGNVNAGTPESTNTPKPLILSTDSSQSTEKIAKTLISTHEAADSAQIVITPDSVDHLGGTIVVPVISSNDQLETISPIVSPSSLSPTMISIEPSSTLSSEALATSVSTPSPVPTVEPTQQPNVFQRFFYFIFPSAKNTETVQTPTNSPTVTSTAPIDEVQPAQKPNIFQRFITFIIPGRDEPTPAITSLPTIPPTVTASVIKPTSISVSPSLSPTAFIPQRDSSSEETQIPTEQISSDTEPETSEKNPTAEPSLQPTNDTTDYLNKAENAPSAEPGIANQPETGTIIPVQGSSENRIELNPRLIMFGNTPTAEATEILVVVGKNVGTEVAITQSTALPKTGVADKWNIPMMILVVMVLLALILGVRLLRNKHS